MLPCSSHPEFPHIYTCMLERNNCMHVGYAMGAYFVSNSFLKRQKIVFSLTALVAGLTDQFKNSNNLRNKALFTLTKSLKCMAIFGCRYSSGEVYCHPIYGHHLRLAHLQYHVLHYSN